MFEDLLHEYEQDNSFDGLCDVALASIYVIDDLADAVKTDIKLSSWDDLAALSLLIYISVDSPYYSRGWLYRLCSISFRNCSLFKEVDGEDMYHVTITNKDGSYDHSVLDKNGFMSAANRYGARNFSKTYTSDRVITHKLNMSHCKGLLNIEEFLDSSKWILKHFNLKYKLWQRVDFEKESIVLFDDVKSLLPSHLII